MNEETRKTYTIRLPERIASRLEASAAEAGSTPTTLIQSVIVGRFESATNSAKDGPSSRTPKSEPQAASRAARDSEIRQEQRHRQLLYEIGKMRSVLLHALDHTLNAEQVDDIIEVSEKTASDYVAELLASKGRQQ